MSATAPAAADHSSERCISVCIVDTYSNTTHLDYTRAICWSSFGGYNALRVSLGLFFCELRLQGKRRLAIWWRIFFFCKTILCRTKRTLAAHPEKAKLWCHTCLSHKTSRLHTLVPLNVCIYVCIIYGCIRISYVYIYIDIYIYIYIYVYRYVCMQHICIHIHVYAYKYTTNSNSASTTTDLKQSRGAIRKVYAYLRVYIYSYMLYIYIHTHIYIRICIHICCIHTYLYTYMYIYMYISI